MVVKTGRKFVCRDISDTGCDDHASDFLRGTVSAFTMQKRLPCGLAVGANCTAFLPAATSSANSPCFPFLKLLVLITTDIQRRMLCMKCVLLCISNWFI